MFEFVQTVICISTAEDKVGIKPFPIKLRKQHCRIFLAKKITIRIFHKMTETLKRPKMDHILAFYKESKKYNNTQGVLFQKNKVGMHLRQKRMSAIFENNLKMPSKLIWITSVYKTYVCILNSIESTEEMRLDGTPYNKS